MNVCSEKCKLTFGAMLATIKGPEITTSPANEKLILVINPENLKAKQENLAL